MGEIGPRQPRVPDARAEALTDARPHAAEEQDERYACLDTEDFRTGYRAFLAKAKPRFGGK